MIFTGFNTDFKIHDKLVNDKSNKKTRKLPTKNINKLKSLINTFDWSYVYSDININILVGTFLYMLFNLCCSKVIIKPTYKNRKPWLCPNLLKCIVKKYELYKYYLQNINSETNSNLSIVYKKYKNILTSVLRKADKLHYSNDLMSDTFKATWNIINNLLKKKINILWRFTRSLYF